MGGASAGSNSGGNRDTSANNVPPSRRKYQPVTGTLSDPREKDDTAAKASLFRETGATNIRNTTSKFPTPTLVIASKPLQAGSRITRDFFKDKVLGSKNYKGTTKQDFERMSRTAQESMYKSYITGRTSGKTDAYGNPVRQGNNENTPRPTILKKTAGGQTIQTTAPTEAELSQSAAADAEAYDLRKTKKRGRSMTTLTSSKGLTDDKLTLGKPSLLGS